MKAYEPKSITPGNIVTYERQAITELSDYDLQWLREFLADELRLVSAEMLKRYSEMSKRYRDSLVKDLYGTRKRD